MIWLRRLLILCEGSFASIMSSNYVHWLMKMIIIYFWSSQNGILTVSDLSFDCVQIFSPDIAVSKKLPCFTLPTFNVLYRYTPDIHIVNHLVISNVCELCYPCVLWECLNCLKLYFNLFFDTDFISIDTIIIVSPSMKKWSLWSGASHKIQQHRININNQLCSYNRLR